MRYQFLGSVGGLLPNSPGDSDGFVDYIDNHLGQGMIAREGLLLSDELQDLREAIHFNKT